MTALATPTTPVTKGNTQPPAHLHHFFRSPLRQRPSRDLPVTDIAVGCGNQFDVVP
jgi:hypothetical protein